MTQVLRPNNLRKLLKNGEPTLGTHILSSWPAIIETIGLTGTMDYIEFFSTYGPFDLYALDNMARAAELYDLPLMIKVDPIPNLFIAQRAIGSGFQSVLFADLRTVKDVEDAIRAVKAEPEGWNGCSMHRIEGWLLESGTKKFADYAKDIVIAVMMEKKSLYDKIEDVMNLDGVDMIQFGPCDFAMNLSVHGQTSHPKVIEAEERTIKMALKYDKHPRAEIDSDATGTVGFQKILKRYQDLGVTDFCIGDDAKILYQWMKDYGPLTRNALRK